MERRYENGKASNKVVEALGREDKLLETHGDPESWAKAYVESLNAEAGLNVKPLTATWNPAAEIPFNREVLFNGGYLFLQRIYNDLGLPRACRTIQKKTKSEYDLNNILSTLIYLRLIRPDSKRASVLNHAPELLEREPPRLHTVYRALSVLAAEKDWLQAFVYKRSKEVVKRSDHILYYDVSNFYWEIEEEDDFRKYGHSKENRPNPIVQMGLFMDASGMPLAYSLWPGNTNEQVTLKPLEEKILRDFDHAKFVVCTDAGLSSKSNRTFNTQGKRAFVTTQSLKQMKQDLRDWALSPTGWKRHGDKSGREWHLDAVKTADRNAVFYKERWIKDDKLEQRLVVTFSRKYMEYQRHIREGQIERARKMIAKQPAKLKTKGVNDCRRFIQKVSVTKDGEIADAHLYTIDDAQIQKEAAFDGFYGVCTDLEDDISTIVHINKGRWEIEEAFRIMKHELEARPVYLSRHDRIEAHFLICFLTLLILRLVERRLEDAGFRDFTVPEIVDTLRSIRYGETQGIFLPMFVRTTLTQALATTFGLPIHQEAYGRKQIRSLIADSRR